MKMFDKNTSLDKKKIKWSGGKKKKMLLLTGTVVQIRPMGEGNIK